MLSKKQEDEMDAVAKDALERSDVAELSALYVKSRKQNADLVTAFETIVEHYSSRTDSPRRANSEDAVAAMRDVALAAIELAGRVLPPSQAVR